MPPRALWHHPWRNSTVRSPVVSGSGSLPHRPSLFVKVTVFRSFPATSPRRHQRRPVAASLDSGPLKSRRVQAKERKSKASVGSDPGCSTKLHRPKAAGAVHRAPTQSVHRERDWWSQLAGAWFVHCARPLGWSVLVGRVPTAMLMELLELLMDGKGSIDTEKIK